MPKRLIHDPQNLSTTEVAKLLGVSTSTVVNWSNRGSIPEPRYIGNKRVWTEAQVDEIRKNLIPKEG
jgi:excisionase family DNA binding protein